MDDVERLVRLAGEARAAAEEALAKVREALADGKGAVAKSRSIAYGTCVAKAGLLAQQAQQALEHEIRVTEEQAKILARVIRGLWTDLGLAECFRPDAPAAELVRHHLLAGDGPVPGPGPAEHVTAARAELRAVVRAELLAEGLVVEARPKLPPAAQEARNPPAASEATHQAAAGAELLPEKV